MRLTMRIGGCVVAAIVAAGAVSAAPGAATPATGGIAGRPASGLAADRPFHTVTLITGDRLSVATDGSHDFAVVPTPGREKVTFVTNVVRDHLEVTPVDALPMVRDGRLDSRLFDVTALLSYGYDDRRANLPLIVAGRGAGLRGTAVAAGATVVRELPAVNGYAVEQSRAHAAAYWNSLTGPAGAGTRVLRDDVDMIWLDAKARLSLDVSVPQIGAPTAWAAGYTGAGVAVGVLDTGIDDTHPDLAGRVVAAQDFTGSGDTVDRVGHGTHVASTIAGSGAASHGRYRGVAPDAKLSSAKVCLANGCADSWVIAGMQWAAEVQGARVVNMSLGGTDTPGLDPMEQAVQTLTAKFGTLFVIAAGNNGNDGSVNSPSTADDALSVGAVDKAGRPAGFSSRGPRTGDDGLKPEITAPGVGIVAARAAQGRAGTSTGPGGRYTSLQGTSMATPHVAGSAAILAQQHPGWKPAQLKAALMASAKPNPVIGVHAQGAGRVDVARAITQQVTSSPTTVNLGRQDWPHADDKPITRTVTYHNAGPAPVTLTLAMNTVGPDGTPTADGLFTVSPTTVTVPAGGEADVAVTADTRVGGTDGSLGGHLTATAAGVAVQTPVAVIRDIESYDLTLKVVDRTGAAATNFNTYLYGLDTSSYRQLFDASGTVAVRLPAGRYNLFTVVYEQDGRAWSMLVQPVVRLDRAQIVTLDARSARPISITVPEPTARIGLGGVQYTLPGAGETVASGLVSFVFDGIYTAHVGPRTPVDGFTTRVQTTWGLPQPNGWMTETPYQYHLLWPRRGSFITGFHRDVTRRDLATVHKDVAASGSGVWAQTTSLAHLQGSGGSSWALAYLYSASASHVEYYNAESGLQWASRLVEQVPGSPPFWRELSTVHGPYAAYRRGRTYRETWNRGVFGPVLPERSQPANWMTRTGDTLVVNTPAYGDGSGRSGTSATDSASVTVYKDGVLVGTASELSGRFTVAAEPGRYRVVQEGDRSAPFVLSTKVRTAWTFRSGHVDGTTAEPLPVSVVRFSPRLDAQNKAPSNVLFGIPVRIQHQPGSAARHTRSLDVQVSYDDGQTWTRVLVLGHGDARVALLRHPAGGGFVSLKAKAADAAGNSVEQTIIHAYRF